MASRRACKAADLESVSSWTYSLFLFAGIRERRERRVPAMPQQQPPEGLEGGRSPSAQTVVLGAQLARELFRHSDWGGRAVERGLGSATYQCI
jgi:hypothetical protein